MPAESFVQQLVRLDQGLHRFVVRARVLGDHVRLHAPAGALAAVGEFADELAGEKFRGRGRLHDLREQSSGRASFFDAGCEFSGGWQLARGVTAGKVVLVA